MECKTSGERGEGALTDREIGQKLKNFGAVWQRVQKNKKLPGSAKLMPGKSPKSRAVRFGGR